MYDLDIDLSSPEDVPTVLADAAVLFRQNADECIKVNDAQGLAAWDKLAAILDRAANECERLLGRLYDT